ncbi:MAG: metallophosphoesterase [Azospirillum sp.]|nr:metallophosphoesterase [Azospirillum sp.]
MTIAIETTEWQPAPAPTKKPFVAIGDIHGCAHLLSALRARLDAEAPHRRIYLGDYVDPSPEHVENHDVGAVLDQIADDLDRGAVILAGNHELMMLASMRHVVEDSKRYPVEQSSVWLASNRGGSTLDAFGVPRLIDFKDRMRILNERISDRQHRVFSSLRFAYEIDEYLFVHAGFYAEPSWREQIEAEDWFSVPMPDRRGYRPHPMWSCLEGDEGPSGYVQVNGHTIVREPFVGARRIAIDTGAVLGGPLTAAEIVGDRLRFHHACPAGVTMAKWKRRE